MRSLRNSPIQWKITLIALLVSSVAVLLASAVFVAYEFHSSRRGAVARLETLAQVVASNSSAALAFGNDVDAAANLQVLATEPQIVIACFYSDGDELFAAWSRSGRALACPPRAPASVGAQFQGDDLVYTLPVLLETEQLGTLMMGADTMEIRARLKRTMGVAGGVLAVCSLVAMVLASRLQRLISTPILGLVDAARRISSEKDYAIRAAHHGTDELGLLIDSFNEMLAQIQHRDRELERHSEVLDAKVRTRTLELQLAVENLEAEIAQREQAEERIRYLAYYDVLTGLPNREHLTERLEVTLTRGTRRRLRPLALLFLDLDRFKKINDTYGHAKGDQLLQQVASRLLCCVRGGADEVSRLSHDHPPTTVSRQGGDEFTILLTDLATDYDAGRVAQRILESLAEPFVLESQDLVVSASIGISLYPQDGTDPETLIKHADAAMYHAKENGGNDFEFVSEDMKAEALERLTLEADLRRALVREELFLEYQALVELKTGRVRGFEALARWRHPSRGLVPPSRFIPIAEECGLILELGDWILKEACRQCAAWSAAGLPRLTVAVNISSRQLRKGVLLESATRALGHSRIDPGQLELEVTENSMIENQEVAVEALLRLKALGVRIALDDFGTGYSSLSYLKNLPLDTVKIDRSFVEDLDREGENQTIVPAIIDMAHGLALEVLAEGIESSRQLRILDSWGCDVGQGYLYSPPVAGDRVPEVLSWLGDRRSDGLLTVGRQIRRRTGPKGEV